MEIAIRVNKEKDPDVYHFLEKQDNVSGVIKEVLVDHTPILETIIRERIELLEFAREKIRERYGQDMLDRIERKK